MRCARPRAHLIGEHDFSVLPRRRLPVADAGEDAARASRIERRGAYWRFDFDANAFLHHMVRNIMGCLRRGGQRPPAARLDGRGAGRAQPRRRGADLPARRPVLRRAVLRCARMRIPEHTAGHGLAALRLRRPPGRLPDEHATAHQDLRPDARGRCRRRRRRRRRRGGLRALRQAARATSRRRAPPSSPRRLPPFVTPVLLFVNAAPRRGAPRRRRACRRRCCSSTATRRRQQCDAAGRPYLRAARMARRASIC